jgi:hypothetical protein
LIETAVACRIAPARSTIGARKKVPPNNKADPARDLRLRVISSSNNGIWIFVERDSASAGPHNLS